MGRAFEVRKAAKAKTAAAKSKVYSKYGREIFVAAKNGSSDPEINQELKRVIEKAKKDQVPNDIIKRAIEKAEGGVDENYHTIKYEVFGPGQSILIIDCLTDNTQRTLSGIRTAINRTDGKIGVSGSVLHQFEQLSVFKIPNLSEDDILMILIENDLDPKLVEQEEDGILLMGQPNDYFKIKTALLNYDPNLDLLVDELTWIPFNYVTLTEEEQDKFDKFIDLLDELDDVQDVYHNVE